jgi:hypothetical protein
MEILLQAESLLGRRNRRATDDRANARGNAKVAAKLREGCEVLYAGLQHTVCGAASQNVGGASSAGGYCNNILWHHHLADVPDESTVVTEECRLIDLFSGFFPSVHRSFAVQELASRIAFRCVSNAAVSKAVFSLGLSPCGCCDCINLSPLFSPLLCRASICRMATPRSA